METLGWIMAAIAGVFSTGLVIGVVLTSRRAIHVTQTNTTSQQNSNSGGSGSGVKSGPSAPVVFPILAVLALGAVAVVGMTTSAQSGAQVTAVSQQALESQREIIRAMPTPAPPVVIDRPVAQAERAPSVIEIVIAVSGIANVSIWGYALISKRKYAKRVVRRVVKQPQGISHPAFNKQTTNIDRVAK